jgi:acetyl esterase
MNDNDPAGGFTIGSARSYDNYLLHLSKSLQVTAVSTEYRLAPEHSYPTPHHDCSDAVLFALSRDGEAQLGGPLRMLAGESAGATLAVSVALALRDRPGFDLQSQISSMLLSYGVFDMTGTPSLLDHKREAVVGTVGMKKFIEAAFSHVPPADRKNPDISPLFMDLSNLPPALFLCGTEDPLLDDSNFMASRWSMAGNVTEVSLIPGGWHGFTIIPAGEITDHGLDELVRFGLKHL